MRAIHTPGGIYLGDAPGMTVDYRRLAKTAARIVKGLFWHKFGRRLEDTHLVEVMFTDLQKDTSAIEDANIQELIALLGHSGLRHTSNESIESWGKVAEDDENCSFWYIRICKTVGYFAATFPKDG